jgi:RNA polymerase sigma-70 factor (ECF subfamily)
MSLQEERRRAMKEVDEAIRAVREGHHAAFRTVVEQTQRDLRAYVALHAPVRELVDEVAQQTYITAFERIGTYRAGTHLLAWLKRIAWNHLQNERRRIRRREVPVEDVASILAAPAQTAGPEHEDQLAALRRCLSELAPNVRRLVELRYKHDLPPTELARRESRPPATIRTILTRARRALLECLERHHVC